MANWTSVATPPDTSGKYRAKCGNSGDTFWAMWKKREKVWTNLKGDEIAFGRPECGDAWREAVRSNVELTPKMSNIPEHRTLSIERTCMAITREHLEKAAKAAGFMLYESNVFGLCIKIKDAKGGE